MIEPATLFDTSILIETRLSADVRVTLSFEEYCWTTPGGNCSNTSSVVSCSTSANAEDASVPDRLLATVDPRIKLLCSCLIPVDFAAAAA